MFFYVSVYLHYLFVLKGELLTNIVERGAIFTQLDYINVLQLLNRSVRPDHNFLSDKHHFLFLLYSIQEPSKRGGRGVIDFVVLRYHSKLQLY